MKTIQITIVLLFMSFLAIGQNATSEQKAIDNITTAVKVGNSNDLSVYFASSIKCDILEKDNVYSKAQATQVMKDFFNKYKAKSFSILHKSGKPQLRYIIGPYATTAGESFRMTFILKQEGNNYFIQQIIIKNGSEE